MTDANRTQPERNVEINSSNWKMKGDLMEYMGKLQVNKCEESRRNRVGFDKKINNCNRSPMMYRLLSYKNLTMAVQKLVCESTGTRPRR